MSEDITQDPEYIKGYEAAKEQLERDKSPHNQGWHAAYAEKRKKERDEQGEAKATDTITISVEYPQMKEIISLMGRLLEHNEQLVDEMKTYNERLKKLERYTQE